MFGGWFGEILDLIFQKIVHKQTDLYFQLKDKLEQIFKRQIDLIEERGIKNSFFRKAINESKVVIYG